MDYELGLTFPSGYISENLHSLWEALNSEVTNLNEIIMLVLYKTLLTLYFDNVIL